MKYLFTIFILYLIACKSNINRLHELQIVEQTPSHILIDGGRYYSKQGVILRDTINAVNMRRNIWSINKGNYIPEFAQIKKIEMDIASKYGNEYKKYYRQYYGYIKVTGDTIIETLLLTKRMVQEYSNWKNSIYEVMTYDGPSIRPSRKKIKKINAEYNNPLKHKWKFDYLLQQGRLQEVFVRQVQL